MPHWFGVHLDRKVRQVSEGESDENPGAVPIAGSLSACIDALPFQFPESLPDADDSLEPSHRFGGCRRTGGQLADGMPRDGGAPACIACRGTGNHLPMMCGTLAPLIDALAAEGQTA